MEDKIYYDRVGQKLELGDKVAFSTTKGCDLYVGSIYKITARSFIVESRFLRGNKVVSKDWTHTELIKIK